MMSCVVSMFKCHLYKVPRECLCRSRLPWETLKADWQQWYCLKGPPQESKQALLPNKLSQSWPDWGKEVA